MLLKNKFKMTNITISDMNVGAQKNLQKDRLQKKETLETKLKLMRNEIASGIMSEIGNTLTDDLQKPALADWTEKVYSHLLRLTETYGEDKVDESFNLIKNIEDYFNSQTMVPELSEAGTKSLTNLQELRKYYFK